MRIVLSARAEADLREILRFSWEQWGEARALAYVEGLREKLALLGGNPRIGAPAETIRPGLRRLPYVRHVAYYRIIGDRVRIVRILHQQMSHAPRL